LYRPIVLEQSGIGVAEKKARQLYPARLEPHVWQKNGSSCTRTIQRSYAWYKSTNSYGKYGDIELVYDIIYEIWVR
jgi:hypothetical protein